MQLYRALAQVMYALGEGFVMTSVPTAEEKVSSGTRMRLLSRYTVCIPRIPSLAW